MAMTDCVVLDTALRCSSCSCSVDCNTTVHDTQIAEIGIELHGTYVVIIDCAVRIELDKAVVHIQCIR